MNSLPIDIVLLPSEDLAKRVIAASHDLQRYGTLFELSASSPFPHLSIYMTQLKQNDIDNALQLLSDIACKTPVLQLIAKGYYQSESYLDPDYERIPEIAELQTKVIEVINPIRDGLREKDRVRMLEATGIVRDNLEKYGYRGVGELFRPHMTLTRFINAQTIDVNELPDVSIFDGKFVSLGMFEMGNNGTCVRKIAEFKLQ